MEKDLEKALLEQLQNQEYEHTNIAGTQDLKDNLKKQIQLNNHITFEGDEFERLYKELINVDSIFNASKKIRDRLLFERIDGTKLNLLLYNTTQWCKNNFQVANQIFNPSGNFGKKYDVTILINGFPMVQIELKNTNVAIENAFKQIVQDYKESYNDSLFIYLQLFVISNGNTTKYFVNNKIIEDFALFTYANQDNKPINSLHEFTNTFLNKCYLSKIISRYIVLLHSKEEARVLRSYQIHAVEKIVDKVENSISNGYIWHTTGSGKTLTSFKTATILKNNPKLAKILFVVDRKDLDQQTIAEFNKFEADCVDLTQSTNHLITKLKSNLDSDKVIVTTIQKLNKALGENKSNDFSHLQEKKVVFIFDECHRSTFGESFQKIKSFFKNGQYFGFTGTPIFTTNASSKGIDVSGEGYYKTTQDIFKQELHSYTIANAIADKSVLSFNVSSLQDTTNLSKQKIVEAIYSKHNHITTNKKFNAIFATNSIEEAIEYYRLFKENNKVQEFPLNVVAIFSSPSGNLGSTEELDSEEKTKPEVKKAGLEEIQKDYNEKYKLNITDYAEFYNNVSKRFKSYGDYTKNNKKEETIDILIVVDMFLTGYDSPITNTLYVDKNLKYHGLIQAFSRTNRIAKSKPFGNIIIFKDLQNEIDEAVKMYSAKTDDAQPNSFMTQPFPQSKEDLSNALNKFKNHFEAQGLKFQAHQWHNIKSSEVNHIVKADFSALLKAYHMVESYDTNEEQKQEIENILSKETLSGFIGVYKDRLHQESLFNFSQDDAQNTQLNNQEQNEENLVENAGEDSKNNSAYLDEKDLEELFTINYIIDYDYIVKLLYKYGKQIADDKIANNSKELGKDYIISEIRNSTYLQNQKDLLINNLDEIQQNILNKNEEDFKEYLNNFLEQKKQERKNEIINKYNANADVIDRFISKYTGVGTIDYKLLSDSLPKMGLIQKHQQQNELKQELLEYINKLIK